MFNSYATNYQRVEHGKIGVHIISTYIHIDVCLDVYRYWYKKNHELLVLKPNIGV